MAFPNAKKILRAGSPLSTWKLLLIAASFSRPQFRGLCHLLLRPFVHDGMIPIRYRCGGRFLKIWLRVDDLNSDFQSCIELGVDDSYGVDEEFLPNILVDGGGNIGLFTLRTVAEQQARGNTSMTAIICEPIARNVEHIHRHLAANHMEVRILEGCLGGTRRTLPFYCREAINSSFDPEKPYHEVIQVPVYLLEDAIGGSSAERILVKLDIEGMEVEVLKAFLPGEQRAVYIVGELHECAIHASEMETLFHENGWTYEIWREADDQALFRACSPAALPLLPSMRTRNSAQLVS